MRTPEEFQKEMQEAHDCEKCRGKIFCVSCDFLGNTYCTYCNKLVRYSKPTKEEIKEWIKPKN